jgi:hypothetical protein
VEIKGRGALSNKDGRFARREREPDGDALDAALRDGDAAGAAHRAARRRGAHDHRAQRTRPTSASVHRSIRIAVASTAVSTATRAVALRTSTCRRAATFETQIFYKPNAVELLRDELAAPSYVVSPIALGTNTDPYQPVEKQLRITRGILELLLEHRHPLTIVTKGGLILRDLDLLERLAADGLAAVMVSVTTLDDELKRKLEPRTAGPNLRLKMIRELGSTGSRPA